MVYSNLFSNQIFQVRNIHSNFLKTFQNSEPSETYAVVNKTQPKKNSDLDKDNFAVIHENDPEQDPYTAPTLLDNTYDVSKLDRYGLVKLFLT